MTVEQDFNFISQRDVVDAPTVDRDSIAYAPDADDVLTQYAADVIRSRFTDDGDFAGYLIEPNAYTSIINESEDFSTTNWYGQKYYYQNYLLYSEDFSNAAWTKFNVLSTTDSGIAAPTINGETFGNYWKVVPNTSSAAHSILQVVSPAIGTDISVLLREGGYDYVFFRIDDSTTTLIYSCVVNLITGEITSETNPSNYDVSAVDQDTGDWLLTATSLTGTLVGRVVFQPRETEGTSVFAGNGTDGLLVTRAHQSAANKSYVTTTTAQLDYEGITSFTINGTSQGPDGVATSASRIDMTGGAGMEYYVDRDRNVGTTTMSFGTATVANMATLELLSPAEGDPEPTLLGVGATVEGSGTGSFTANAPGGVTADDIQIVIIEHSASGSFSASGWTSLYTNQQSGGTSDSFMTVYWRRYVSGSSNASLFASSSFDHYVAKQIVFSGCITSGSPFGDTAVSASAVTGTSKTFPTIETDRLSSLVLFIGTYGNDAASNATSAWTNANLASSVTVSIDGVGTAIGDGGGIVAAYASFEAAQIEGVIRAAGNVEARPSVFIKKVSGSDTVRLYNNQSKIDYVDIDLTDPDNPPTGATVESYTNGWYRISSEIDNATADYAYGFGLSGEGVYDVLGANLVPTLDYYQYLLDDTTMVGDTILEQSGANLVYSSVDEPDATYDVGPNGAAVIWTAGTYNTGDWAIEDHLIYQVVATPSTTDQPSVGAAKTTPTWAVVRPSNRWSMINKLWENGTINYYNDQTATYGAGFVEIAIQSQFLVDSIGMHNIDAQRVIIRNFVEGVLTDELEIDLTSTNGIDDYYDWFLREPQTISQAYSNAIPWRPDGVLSIRFEKDSATDIVTVGKITLGTSVTVGTTLTGVEIDGRDFSRTERNEYGNAGIRQGREIDIKRYNLLIPDSQRVAYLNQLIKDQGVQPTTWVGNINYESTIVLGFRSERGFDVDTYRSTATLAVKEL